MSWLEYGNMKQILISKSAEFLTNNKRNRVKVNIRERKVWDCKEEFQGNGKVNKLDACI
jgi:hypothetical protein